ncbi:MAG: VCBS repeat-containing protein [Bacteroidota bacterium]
MLRYFLLSAFCFSASLLLGQTATSMEWTYFSLDSSKGKWGDWDEPNWLRYFGLDMGDMDRDGDLDVLSGRYLYQNPGGDMSGTWARRELPENVDGIFLMDVDGDAYADVIAQALPKVIWLEAKDQQGNEWRSQVVGEIPATSHTNSQGFERGQLIVGGKEEFVIAGNGNLYLFRIPNKPESQSWTPTLIAANTSDEGIGLGDVDGDGDLDLAAGRRPEGGDEPLIVVWYENPGVGTPNWKESVIGTANHPIDRVEVADLNGDGRADIVLSEERYPGKEPDGNLFWYEQPESGTWPRHRVVTQYSMNNLDVADLDQDGDMDLITNEHKGPNLELQLWENDGEGHFSKQVLDQGKENHLGTQLADLDGDGDLDLVGAGWDHYEHMHLWRNEFVNHSMEWEHLSTERGELPPTNGSTEQTASLVVDVNGDGVKDMLITDRTVSPSVIALLYTPNGWERYLIEDTLLRIEAGSAAHDIDGDGDMDVVFGGESRSNEVWWWENPYPNLKPDQPWTRRTIKKSGSNKHHDQLFMDADGDGQMELVFWNQGGQSLCMAEIPADPKMAEAWDWKPIYQYTNDGEPEPLSTYPGWKDTHEHEGLVACDMNDDGIKDIVGGGRWFEYRDGNFLPHLIDPAYTFTRSAAGQLIQGGRPEVLFVVGDGVGPLVLYEWQKGYWHKRILLASVDNGHTLDIVDVNGDGYLDIFIAEMRFGSGNPDSEIAILLGNGNGGFRKQVVARGFGVHEGRIVDLDGDGDYDIMGKPYTWKTPLLNIWLQK